MKKILIPPITELYIGRHILPNPYLLTLSKNRKVVLIADQAINDLYAKPLAEKINATLFTIPSGESAKNIHTAQDLIEKLFTLGAGRDTLLIALGGGVTTDLVGFVASIYMRGIALIFIPTTLLAVVDAAIGGKTGIDTGHGKNLIGTLYYPKAIFVDLNLLDTLPEKQWLNGFAEILKIGLISSSSIWKMANENDRNPDLICQAIEAKIAVVTQDPSEQGLRRILNFGHTIGHGLETATQYELSHGQAVALGCVVEAHLSMRLGYLEEKEFKEILARYQLFSVTIPKTYLRSKLLSAMTLDKKNAAGEIRFVLIDKIGHALSFERAYCRKVTSSELQPTLDWMESWKLST